MKRKIITITTLIWLAVLLRITVFRNGCFFHGFFSGRVEWGAFAYYLELVRLKNWRYFSYLFFGNMIWFVPLGILIRIRNGRLCHAVLAGFLLSLSIETAQYVLGSGVSELDDLILNTFGAFLGYLGTAFFILLFSRGNKE